MTGPAIGSVSDRTYVEALPNRIAHAVHALMFASEPGGGGAYGPFTAAEVCIYDAHWEALTARHTAAALREGQRRGLAMHVPPRYWTPTSLALALRRPLGERFLADEAGEA